MVNKKLDWSFHRGEDYIFFHIVKPIESEIQLSCKCTLSSVLHYALANNRKFIKMLIPVKIVYKCNIRNILQSPDFSKCSRLTGPYYPGSFCQCSAEHFQKSQRFILIKRKSARPPSQKLHCHHHTYLNVEYPKRFYLLIYIYISTEIIRCQGMGSAAAFEFSVEKLCLFCATSISCDSSMSVLK